jgi:hypothetical protein
VKAKTDHIAMLGKSIRILEIKQAREGQLLKEQLRATREKYTPSNLIKSTISDIAATPGIKSDIAIAGLRLAAGYIASKLNAPTTAGPLRRFLGTAIQLVANGKETGISKDLNSSLSAIARLFTSKEKS